MAKIEIEEVTQYTVTLTEEEAKGLVMLIGHGTTGTTCDALNLKELWKALDEQDLDYEFPYFKEFANLRSDS